MELITKEYAQYVKEKISGTYYIPWGTMVQMAAPALKHPLQVLRHGEDGTLTMPLFGGHLVAVQYGDQIVWLPVLSMDGRPQENPSAKDIGASVNRCRCKAAAMATGYGIGIYAHVRSAKEFMEKLRGKDIQGGTALANIPPLVIEKKKGVGYVPWAAAYAAAKLADPSLTWEVRFFREQNMETGEVQCVPYSCAPGGGFLVSVIIRGQHGEHEEILPILGIQEVMTKFGKKKLDHQTLPMPTVADWNRAVMRALTKGIAFATGYGISLYGDEDDDIPAEAEEEPITSQEETPQKKESPKTEATQAKATKEEEETPQKDAPKAEAAQAKAREERILLIREKLEEYGKPEKKLLEWLGAEGSLEDLEESLLKRAEKALKIA